MAPQIKSENSRTALMVPNEQDTPRQYPQFLAAYLATLSALCVGMCLSWSSSAIPMLQRVQRETYTPLVTNGEAAWIGSLITLGACLGAIPTGSLSNALGRKKTLQILALPLFLSWILIGFGNHVLALYAARFVAGLAVGGISVAAPMYVAELAHKSIRGTLGTFFQVQVTIGVLVEYILGGTIENFQILSIVSSAFPLVFLSCFTFMPESPVFLCSKGKLDEAKDSLVWFRGENYCTADELKGILMEIKKSSQNKTKLSDLMNSRATLKGLTISLGLMAFQQLSGINAIIFYTGKIFSESGSSMTPDACAILVGAIMVLATLLSTILVDKCGRRILLLVSDFVMCLCLATLGVYFYVKQYQDMSQWSIIPLTSVAIFIVVFSIGLGPIPWMIMGEIFTPEVKGVGSSISASLNWMLAFTVTNQFQNLVSCLGNGITFIIFSFICAVGTVFITFMVPETKGKSVEEVQDILLDKNKNNKIGLEKC